MSYLRRYSSPTFLHPEVTLLKPKGNRGIGVSGRGGKPPGVKPYVALLLHMDGANGGTTFTDSSPLAKTPTVSNAQTSTSPTPQFGTACGHAVSATAQGGVTWPSSADYVFTNDRKWSLDFFLYAGNTGSTAEYLLARDATVYASYSPSTRVLSFFNYGAFTTAALTALTWHHIAVDCNPARGGLPVHLYVNGVYTASAAGGSAPSYKTNSVFGIFGIPGRADLPSLFNSGSYIDELRIVRNTSFGDGATYPVPVSAYS